MTFNDVRRLVREALHQAPGDGKTDNACIPSEPKAVSVRALLTPSDHEVVNDSFRRLQPPVNDPMSTQSEHTRTLYWYLPEELSAALRPRTVICAMADRRTGRKRCRLPHASADNFAAKRRGDEHRTRV
jgi:hypothetical protein